MTVQQVRSVGYGLITVKQLIIVLNKKTVVPMDVLMMIQIKLLLKSFGQSSAT